MSFEGKNGKSSLKYQKILEIFAIYGTTRVQKNNPFGPNLTSGYPPRVGFLVPPRSQSDHRVPC